MSKEKNTVELKDEQLEKVAGGIPDSGLNNFEDFVVKRVFSCPNCGKSFSYAAYEKNGNACPTCNPKDQSYMT